MKDLQIVLRYTTALFELAREARCEREIENELLAFSDALKSSADLWNFFESPRFSLQEKKKALEKIFSKQDAVSATEASAGRHETLAKFFSLLLQKNRFGLLHEIALAFKNMEDDEGHEGVVEIRTVAPLDGEHEKTILRHLEKIMGYRLSAEKKLDPALLGGVYVKFKNRILDGSVRNQLNVIKKKLVQTAI